MGMTNGEKIKVILKPRTDQIRIYGDWVEIEIQSLGINFSCELSWWNAEYKEPQTFKWCTDCKEYDQEKHCCPKLSKVIRDTVEEMKQEKEPMQVDLEGDGYADGELVYDYGKCPKCGWDFEEGDKDWKEPFCCHCGQKLKWFDNDAGSEVEDGNN